MIRRFAAAALLGLTVAAGVGMTTATAHTGTTTTADSCDPTKQSCGPPRDPWEWD